MGDATKARTKLGWKPSVNFDQLVALMVEADWNAIRTVS
jgi:GDPmannose 4,6-dehydratase